MPWNKKVNDRLSARIHSQLKRNPMEEINEKTINMLTETDGAIAACPQFVDKSTQKDSVGMLFSLIFFLSAYLTSKYNNPDQPSLLNSLKFNVLHSLF